MAPDLVGDMILAVLYIGGFCTVLGVCGFLADYVLPRFPKVERALFSLVGIDPDDFEDDYEKEGGVR